MKRKFSGKQTGIVIALVLAVVILFLPAQDSRKYRFDPGQIAASILGNSDQVDPLTLSAWIIEGRADYLLIDIRSAEEFAAGNIQGAANIPLAQLLEKNTIDGLPRDKVLVLYANGSTHAAQAWLVLQAAGLPVYVLEGGLNYWNEVVLNPQPPTGQFSDDEILRYKMRLAVKNYFEGQGTAASAAGDITVPAAQAKKGILVPLKKKKLKGC